MNQTMHAELSRLSSLIDLIYQGATAMNRWQEVLPAIANWLDSRTGLLFTPLHTPEQGGFQMVHQIPQSALELWNTKYAGQDLWTNNAVARGLVVEGNILLGQELVPQGELIASHFYQEFLSRLNIAHLLTGIVFGIGPESIATICSFHRFEDEEPFSESQKEKLSLLVPHISRALGVMFRLRDAEFKVASTLAALDRLPIGVLLFGTDGGVTFANSLAKSILDQQDGLRLRNRPGLGDSADVLASDHSFQNLLDEAIREAISPDILSTRHFSRAVAITRPSGRASFLLNFSSLPASNEFGMGWDAPRAIVFISDSATPIKLNNELLKSAYGLSAAEIRVAELVADGFSLQEIAKQHGRSVNTIKTQLKQIYEKTGTNSRARLVKLLIALAAAE